MRQKKCLRVKGLQKMNIDWNQLGFELMETKCHIKYTWRNGEWNDGEVVESPYLQMHVAATALHYGQAAFEGLKAFRGIDGKVRIFRPRDNAHRLENSASRTLMAQVPEDLFVEAVSRAVSENIDFVPPHESGGALYIRPLLIGTGARIGIQAADEYTFIVMVTPVGNYYKGGLKPVDAIILDDFDRTAPRGTGDVKIAGNYAASFMPAKVAKEKGFPINLYLDSKEHKYIDEFGTSNFIAIKGNSYITPKSPSVLPSITNLSLMSLAEDMGMTVEKRPVLFEEVSDFEAVGACGTAVVLTPVHRIYKGDEIVSVGDGTVHPRLLELYNRITEIQRGAVADNYDWCHFV